MLLAYLAIISSLFIFIFGYYVFLKDSRRGMNILFFLLSIATALAGGASGALVLISPGFIEIRELITTPESTLVYAIESIGTIGMSALPALFLHLALLITEQGRIFKKKITWISLYFLPLFILSIVLIRGLFLISSERLGLEKNIANLVNSLLFFYYGLFILLSYILLIKRYFFLRGYQERNKLRYFILGASVPIIPSLILLYILPVFRLGMIIPSTYLIVWPLFLIGYLFIGQGIIYGRLFVDYREILETVFKRLTELVILTDKDGVILLTNDITLSKLKLKEEELLGKKLTAFWEEKNWVELKEKIKKEISVTEEKADFFTKEKEKTPFLLVISQIKEGIIFVGRDIKGLVEFQDKLEREVKERTEELDEAKSILEIKVRARTKELQELAHTLEERVEERTKELQLRVEELEKFHRLAIRRELKMVELKEEIEKVKEELKKKS